MLYRWDSKKGKATEDKLRRTLEEGGYRVTRYVYPPGTRFPDHQHAIDKRDGVVSGRFRIEMNGQSFELGPGDFVVVPAGTVHSATVVGQEPVVSLDATRRTAD